VSVNEHKLGRHADDPKGGDFSQFCAEGDNAPTLADTTQPHDALFKSTFSIPEHAAAEFRAVLPPELVALTDFSTPRAVPR